MSSNASNPDTPEPQMDSASSDSSDWAPPISHFPTSGGSARQQQGTASQRGKANSIDHTQDWQSDDNSVSIELDEMEPEEFGPLPEVIGGYRVGTRLGRGGMGEVFLAEHRSMGRTVALKILPAKWLGRSGSVNRFHEEIRAASRLMHPNIVTAFDAGQSEGIHFLAMEYVNGKTLSQIVAEEGPFSIGDATSAIRQAAFALHHAHTAGIIHRDVKPGNLMRSQEGTIKLLDLGLARFSRHWHNANESKSNSKIGVIDPHQIASAPPPESSSAMPSGPGSQASDSLQPFTSPKRSLLGTLAFISPEQLEDPESADARSDQYSLGATLFYLLVGHPPFPGEMIDQVYGHRHGEIPDLMAYRQDIDLTLANIVSRMLAKSPAQRYGSMDEVARAMSPYDNDRSTPAWVLDFAERKLDEEGSTANEISRSTRATRNKTLSVLGIDLGLTHAATAVGLPDGNIQPGWPSVNSGRPQPLFRMAVAERPNSSSDSGLQPGQVLFGHEAYELRKNHPHRVSHCQMMYFGRDEMLRRIDGRMCPPIVAEALCMRRLVGTTLMNHSRAKDNTPPAVPGTPNSGSTDSSIDSVLGATWHRHESWPDAVAITVPGCYDQLHRRAVYTAARIAGLPSVRLIDRGVAIARFALSSDQSLGDTSTKYNEPAVSLDDSDTETILYVGLTGQAFDVAVIKRRGKKLEQVASAGHWQLGAINWSSRLVETIRSRLQHHPKRGSKAKSNRSWLLHAAKVQIAGERAMNSLLLLPESSVEIRHEGRTENVKVTRDEWLTSCDDLMTQIERGIALACSRADVDVTDIDRCFVLSPILRLPPIRKRVFSALTKETSIEFFDYTDAATGAAACVTSELPGHRDGVLPAQTIATHSVGFVVSEATGKRKILPIITRGTPTPARTNRQLGGTAKDEALTLALVESSGLDDEGWQTLGRHRISVDAAEHAPTRKIGFEIDINGLLSVHLERPDLGRTVRLPSLPELGLSPDQWEDWREWVENQA
ncbi:MAG: protein kinase [Rhodopirellula sp. JB044]|uniref:protein kinase domain-containing protein n=1 Tax=Rhodopirellula sp. JB044 TaxID=3342844 RepID=UPI00370BBD6B